MNFGQKTFFSVEKVYDYIILSLTKNDIGEYNTCRRSGNIGSYCCLIQM